MINRHAAPNRQSRKDQNKMVNFSKKRGSSAVFITIIFSSLIAVTLSLVFAARHQAQKSLADAALCLAANSVLSEYDYYVQKEYGLFLIRGTDDYLSKRIRTYSGCSATINAGRFCVASIEPVTRQIVDYMKISSTMKTVYDDNNNDDYRSASLPERTLRHGSTIAALPSRSLPDINIITTVKKFAENLKNPDAIFKTGTTKYLVDSYILRKFNCNTLIANEEHFFKNEVEYVICGELSDKENQRKTDLALKVMRTGLNLSHIYADPEKTAAVTAAAEVITPGVFGTVTQAGIATAWAAAEAINDVNLLHSGHKVPLLKTSASWAVDLDSLINGYDAERGCIIPPSEKGLSYSDYLRVLLFTKNEDIKTARILDLIQINMRKNYDAAFLIMEYAAGISIDADVNGERLSYDKIY